MDLLLNNTGFGTVGGEGSRGLAECRRREIEWGLQRGQDGSVPNNPLVLGDGRLIFQVRWNPARDKVPENRTTELKLIQVTVNIPPCLKNECFWLLPKETDRQTPSGSGTGHANVDNRHKFRRKAAERLRRSVSKTIQRVLSQNIRLHHSFLSPHLFRNRGNRRPGGSPSGGTVSVPTLSFLGQSPNSDRLTSSGIASLSFPVHTCCEQRTERKVGVDTRG